MDWKYLVFARHRDQGGRSQVFPVASFDYKDDADTYAQINNADQELPYSYFVSSVPHNPLTVHRPLSI